MATGRPCTVCRSPDRDEIDVELIRTGGSSRSVSNRFRTVTRSAIERHKPHVPKGLTVLPAVRDIARAESLAEKIRSLESDAARLREKAEKDGDFRAALAAIKVLADLVGLLHKVNTDRTVTAREFLESPEWARIEEALVRAIAPFPGASEAAGRALERLAEE